MAIGPADLTLAEGTTNIVYAWGSSGRRLRARRPDDQRRALRTVRRPGRHRGPGRRGSLPLPVAALSLAGLLAAGVGALRLARTRG